MSSFFGSGIGESQDAKLTEQEQKLVARLLSDPTYFPLEYRTWLKNYIEGAGITVTTSQVRGSGSASSRTGLPAGIIIVCGAVAAVPPDAKLCDGSPYDRVVEQPLYDKIGVTWGAPSGSLFNVPDLRDRSLFGAGAAVGVGLTDGHAFGTRSGWRHSHTVNDPGHSHPQPNEAIGFNKNPSTGSAGAAGGDRSLVEFLGTSSDPTGITVGPAGTNVDGPDWAGVVFAITNGKAA